MGAEVISKEAFTKMIHDMDKDGDGSVDMNEFKAVYFKAVGEMSDEDYLKVWQRIDADGDGNLTVKELASFYGFSWDDSGDGTAMEMTDEQILEALQMHAAMAEAKAEQDKANGETKKPEPEAPAPPKRGGIGDSTLTQINTDISKNPEDKRKTFAPMIQLCEALVLKELTQSKDGQHVEFLLTEFRDANGNHINVRFVDEKGEMPLHKLARIVYTDDVKVGDYKRIFMTLVMLSKEQAKAAGRTLAADVNHQDKSGKTPLSLAIEHKNLNMIDLLFGLDKEGPDTLLTTAQGYTVLHMAVQINDLEVVKSVCAKLQGARKRILLHTRCKVGRTPLHVAAFRDDSDDQPIVKFLLENGAKNDAKDAAGNTASALAGKSGRRASKEVIEEATGGVDDTPRAGRRASRDATSNRASKESMG